MTKFFCPRAIENGGGPDSPFKPPLNGEAEWREDRTCSYCGSLHPDVFMERLAKHAAQVIPTDKSYKAYVRAEVGSEPFKQTYRHDCPGKPECTGPDDCSHWVTREIDETKFYFQHLSVAQQKDFIDLLNTKSVKIGVPGHFYVPPFFCARRAA